MTFHLKRHISEGRFREDLYYRLAQIVIEILPLRARTGDVVLLAHLFLRRFAAEQRCPMMSLGEDAIRALESHCWPGNVRELQNLIKRASIMTYGGRVTGDDLGLPRPSEDLEPGAVSLDLRAEREHAERLAVAAALARTDSNVARTEKILGASRPLCTT